MLWLFILTSTLVAWFLWTAISLWNNYIVARRTGLPIVFSPIAPLNLVWVVFQGWFTPILKPLPWGLGEFTRYIVIGWSFSDKHALHREHGDAFIIVSPGTNELVVADPNAVTAILSRRRDFTKPEVMYTKEPMDVYGPNVDTVEGETWQRHRKITAPSFNERVSNAVWTEALQQARDMLEHWVSQDRGTTDTIDDTMTLALHVLTCAGFGTKHTFQNGLQSSRPDQAMTYRDALGLVLQNIIPFAIFSEKFMLSSFAPKTLRRLGQAKKVFGDHMSGMLEQERRLIASQQAGGANLMSALVRASEDAKEAEGRGGPRQGLTDDEIFGNIFIYSLAGHETTANSLAYTIALLAAYPECQEWLAEEINQVLGDRPQFESSDYTLAFPKLKRCLATMYETLRLYGSVTNIPKGTGSYAQTLIINNKEHVIPPNTIVYSNSQGVQTDPRTWGPDATTWRPGRWMKPGLTATSQSAEVIMEPARGTFIPWADGPRVCPGRKFAQVEFVAVMATLLHKHRVRPALLEGESVQQGKERVLTMVEDSAIVAITLQMQHPKNVSFIWTRKD